MEGFFETAPANSEPEGLTKNSTLQTLLLFIFSCIVDWSSSFQMFTFDRLGKKTKGTKRYMPQKNSVAYALLVTLYRWNGILFYLVRDGLFRQLLIYDYRD